MSEAWFERSFREDYVVIYHHRDEESADREVANLLERLPIHRQGRVLDLCCGSGRHSRAFAKRGYEVVGVDLSPVLLGLAEEQNTFENVTFFQYDMRHIPFTQEFDIVVNLFTSFGYFDDDQESEQVVRNMARALKSGGQVVIDYLNPSYVQAHLVPTSTKEEQGLQITETRWLADGFVKKRITVMDGHSGQPREYLEQVRLFTSEEMQGMLERAGFTDIQYYGDYTYAPYDRQQSPRMISFAVKK